MLTKTPNIFTKNNGHNLLFQKYYGKDMEKYTPFYEVKDNSKEIAEGFAPLARVSAHFAQEDGPVHSIVVAGEYRDEPQQLQHVYFSHCIDFLPGFEAEVLKTAQNNGEGTYNPPFWMKIHNRIFITIEIAKKIYTVKNGEMIEFREGYFEDFNDLECPYGVVVGMKIVKGDIRERDWQHRWEKCFRYKIGIVNYDSLPETLEFTKYVWVSWNEFLLFKKLDVNSRGDLEYLRDKLKHFIQAEQKRKMNLAMVRHESNETYLCIKLGKLLNSVVSNRRDRGYATRQKLVIPPEAMADIRDGMGKHGLKWVKNDNSVYYRLQNYNEISFGKWIGVEYTCFFDGHRLWWLDLTDIKYSTNTITMSWTVTKKFCRARSVRGKGLQAIGIIGGLNG